MLEVVIVCGIGKHGRMSWYSFLVCVFLVRGCVLRKNFLLLVRSFNVERASVRYTYKAYSYTYTKHAVGVGV